MSDKPRDYRDPQDLEDSLDAIRVAKRERALEFFRTCLDTAYHQGRVDMMAEVINIRIETGDL